MPDIDQYDYQRYAILFVDDEEKTRKYFRRLFGEKFRILEASDGVEALAVFQRHAPEIGIIVTDQRMPNETGVGFLSKIAADWPDIIKILSTAYSDIDAAIGSVNHGGIFRYITKPWDIPQLEVTLRRAMEFFIVKRERDALLSAKLQAMGNVLMATRLAAFSLVPVCAGFPLTRAAEAVASFIRLGVSGRGGSSGSEFEVRSPDWNQLHSRQTALAEGLEKELPRALAVEGLSGRTAAFATALKEAGAGEVAVESGNGTCRLSAPKDPTSGLVDALLGRTQDPAVTTSALRVLAAMMALQEVGGTVRRSRGGVDGLAVDVMETPPKYETSPAMQTSRWLFDDDLLISSALGLI